MSVGDPSELQRIGVIGEALLAQLATIEPSVDGEVQYFPCQVQLHSGKSLDRVYLIEAETYIRYWGVWPWEDPGKEFVPLEDVASIGESPYRMPARFANKMYAAGESAMGGCYFSLRVRGGGRLPYVCGNAVDFVDLPPEVSWKDIEDLVPHDRRDGDAWRQENAYAWCPFRRV